MENFEYFLLIEEGNEEIVPRGTICAQAKEIYEEPKLFHVEQFRLSRLCAELFHVEQFGESEWVSNCSTWNNFGRTTTYALGLAGYSSEVEFWIVPSRRTRSVPSGRGMAGSECISILLV